MTKHLGLFGAVVLAFASACGGGSDSDNQCGDGRLGGNEQCDDGNTAGGDGCSATCTTEQPNTCGDGTIDVNNGEQCDDGNTESGDGCSSSCTNESPPNCGNHHVDAGETCDDGNVVSGDGCSSFCQSEGDGGPGAGTCASPFVVNLTATGTTGALTGHVMGTTDGGADQFPMSACGSDDDVIGGGFDSQYVITLAAKSDLTITNTDDEGADLVLRLTTAACDGATGVADVDAQGGCTDEPERLRFRGLAAGTYYLDVDGYSSADHGTFDIQIAAQPSTCGNGTREGAEQCDDNNMMDGDGCSAACTVENQDGTCANPFFVTVELDEDGFGSTEIMGDTSTGANGFAAATCDGTTPEGAGNDHTYAIFLETKSELYIRDDFDDETSFPAIVRVTTAACMANTEVAETPGANGCNPVDDSLDLYNLAPGLYYITVDGSAAADEGAYHLDVSVYPSDCGDGFVDTFEDEECDDGNETVSDGCSTRCTIDPGYICNDDEPSVCMLDVCGNGTLDAGETCDDGNDVTTDGCTGTCQIDPLYTCTGSPSVCTPKPAVCGDGVVEAGEGCDDMNTADGDGCSMACALEFDVTEMETNDTTPQALTAGPHRIKASLATTGDVDLYTFTLAAPAKIELETYTGIDAALAYKNGKGDMRYDCSATPDRDTYVYIYAGTGTGGTVKFFDDDDGADNLDRTYGCSYIGAGAGDTASLAAGTYTIKVYNGIGGSAGDYYIDLHFN